MRKTIGAIGITLTLLLTLGLGCGGSGVPKNVAERLKPMTLVWWGVNMTSEEVQPLIEGYRQIHPYVTVQYRKLRYDEYERAILDAFSEGAFAGPDIVSLPSAWTRRYQSKLFPEPEVITMPFVEQRGTVKKETFGELRTQRLPTPIEVANQFLDVVYDDVVLRTEDGTREAIYGLPLHVDTLVLYANRDLLNAAGIPESAKTWSELQQHAQKLTRYDQTGNILQAAVAMGTGENVQRSFDILSLLMMQNGAVMALSNGAPMFDRIPQALSGQRQSAPALDALLYYTDFANPDKLVYSWNAQQPDSLEAFLQGRVAYFFGYSYHKQIIESRAPRINLAVTGVPHIAAAMNPETGVVVGNDLIEGSQPVALNYADFWVQTIAERTLHPNEAWDFVTFITTRPIVQQYLDIAKRPTALRRFVAMQFEDPEMRVFANQLLTTRTWYRGTNPDGAEQAFYQLMSDTLTGRVP
ncbi:MAG: extracellular solute-binding protein, partial [Candidatus Uhrbacteria bacterium]